MNEDAAAEARDASVPRWAPVLLGFALTRAVVLFLVLVPESWFHGIGVGGDRDLLYRSWSSHVLDHGLTPYVDTSIEYPPGALPFLILPGIFGTGLAAYRLAFVVMIGVIDLLGLVACMRIARRWRSALAPWLWVVLVGLLGPIAYARFDLVPAVMTAWALERAAAGRWGWAGSWLAAGGVAKVYPFLLSPLMFVAAPDRRRFGLATAGVVVAGALPFAFVLGDVWRDVGGYHLSRGIHVESLWGSLLFIASRQGLASQVQFGAGALHFTGDVAYGLKVVCDIAVLAVLGLGIWVSSRIRRGDAKTLSSVMLGTLALAMVASPVLSPQFMLWLIPLGVAVVAAGLGRGIPHLLLGITVATVAIFPFLYADLASGAPLPVILLWGRNLALLGLGILTLRRAWPEGGLLRSTRSG